MEEAEGKRVLVRNDDIFIYFYGRRAKQRV